MDSKKITIHDVARIAGVSPTTVSRALSRPGRVNLDTAKRVRKIADELGYRTKALEPQEEEKLHGSIMTLASDLKYPIFAEFLYGMQNRCLKNNFCLLTATTKENYDIERDTILRMLPHVDGFIFTMARISDSAIRKVATMKPTVIMNREVGGVQAIICDDRPALYATVVRLKELGHTSVSYISGPEASWQNGFRWQSLKTICEREKIRLRQITGTIRGNIFSAKKAFRSYIQHPTSAVIAFNDLQAIELMDLFIAHGIKIPGDVSLIGIDDIPGNTSTKIPLTSIRIPREDMGAVAANRLIERILNKTSVNTTPIYCRSVFIERESIGPAK